MVFPERDAQFFHFVSQGARVDAEEGGRSVVAFHLSACRLQGSVDLLANGLIQVKGEITGKRRRCGGSNRLR